MPRRVFHVDLNNIFLRVQNIKAPCSSFFRRFLGKMSAHRIRIDYAARWLCFTQAGAFMGCTVLRVEVQNYLLKL